MHKPAIFVKRRRSTLKALGTDGDGIGGVLYARQSLASLSPFNGRRP